MSKQSWLALSVLVALLSSGGLVRFSTARTDGLPPLDDSTAAISAATDELDAPIPTPFVPEGTVGNFGVDQPAYGSGPTFSPSSIDVLPRPSFYPPAAPTYSPSLPAAGFGGPVVGSGGVGFQIPR